MKMLENIRNIAIGLGIMVLYPMIIHVGTRLVVKEPRWSELYELKDKVSSREYKEKEKELKQQRKEYEKYYFYTSSIAGLVAIAAGTAIAVPFLGMGLIFGGVICLSTGYFSYWHELSDLFKLASLVLAFLILLGSGYGVMRKGK